MDVAWRSCPGCCCSTCQSSIEFEEGPNYVQRFTRTAASPLHCPRSAAKQSPNSFTTMSRLSSKTRQIVEFGWNPLRSVGIPGIPRAINWLNQGENDWEAVVEAPYLFELLRRRHLRCSMPDWARTAALWPSRPQNSRRLQPGMKPVRSAWAQLGWPACSACRAALSQS